MKCPNCDGKGTVLKIIYEDWQKDEIVRSAVKCPRCNGSGEVPMTNEEWFCQLPTEEKAKFFHGIVIHTMHATWDGKKPDFPAYLSDWKKWLKEKHE